MVPPSFVKLSGSLQILPFGLNRITSVDESKSTHPVHIMKTFNHTQKIVQFVSPWLPTVQVEKLIANINRQKTLQVHASSS